MKRTRSISPLSIFCAVMVLSLAHCSDTALQSALYDKDRPDVIVPPSIDDKDEFFWGKKSSDSDEVQVNAPETTPNNHSTNHSSSTPMSDSWEMQISNKSLLKEALHTLNSVPSATDDVALDLSKLELKIALQTVEILKTQGERHLEGELRFTQKGQKGTPDILITLPHEGPVVYSGTTSHDLMQAEFRIDSRFSIKLELSRRPTKKRSDIIGNPWTGSILLLEGSKEVKIGKITGYVTPLK